MSHTIIETNEFNKIKSSLINLSNGSSICETSKSGKPLRTWEVKNGELILWKDFIELDRPFKKDERANFEAKLTKEFVANFFVNHDENTDNVPQREYSACCDAEYNLFKNVGHSGTYIRGRKSFNIYRVHINQDQNPKEVAKEVEYILALQKKRFKNRKIFQWQIFENTLASGGSYGLDIHKDGTCEITYSYSKPICFKNLVFALEYIKHNHWYQEKTNKE